MHIIHEKCNRNHARIQPKRNVSDVGFGFGFFNQSGDGVRAAACAETFEHQRKAKARYNTRSNTGKNNINHEIKNTNYIQIDFANNIEDFFDACDVVISRAGSNTIFELLAIKKPMLLIPLPKDQSRGDQILNAENFAKRKIANILYQENLNKEKQEEEYYRHTEHYKNCGVHIMTEPFIGENTDKCGKSNYKSGNGINKRGFLCGKSKLL